MGINTLQEQHPSYSRAVYYMYITHDRLASLGPTDLV